MKRLLLLSILPLLASGLSGQVCTSAADVIPCTGFIVGQEENGAVGAYSNTEEWGFLGKGTVPYLTDVPYGMRLQRNGSMLVNQIQERSGGGVYDGVIGIGVVKIGTSNPPLPRLDFNYYYENQVAARTAQLTVMTITGAYSKPVSSSTTLVCPTPVPPAVAPPCYGRVGIENTSPAYTLDVNGMIRAQTTLYVSDARFKQKVTTIQDGMDVIARLRGTTYEFRTDQQIEGFDFGPGLHAGFVAQEVEEVLPHLVATDDQGYKSVAYAHLLPYVVEGMKELKAENEAVMAQNQAILAQNAMLQAQIRALLEGDASGKGAQGSVGSSLPAELYQNVPNPFDQVTEIRFHLPTTVREAHLVIFDMNGKQLRTVVVRERGAGSVKLAARELSSGMYLYTLLADGQEVDTRRMIITE